MAGFTWTPVAGASEVNTATQNVIKAQSQAADTIDKSLKTLTDISTDALERKADNFNTLAEINLQEELNKISDIDKVEDILNLEIDPGALRQQYGEQLGKTGFEPSIARLRGAVEQRQKDLITEEKSLIDRDNLLDLEANRDLFNLYRTRKADQSITELIRDPDSLKKFAEEQKAAGKRVPENFHAFALTEFRSLSPIEEGKTEGEKNTLKKRMGEALFAAEQADELSKQIDSSISSTVTSFGATSSSDLTDAATPAQIYQATVEFVKKENLDVDSFFWDTPYAKDPGAFADQAVAGFEEFNKVFAQYADELKARSVKYANTKAYAIQTKLQASGLSIDQINKNEDFIAANREAELMKKSDPLALSNAIYRNIVLTPRYLFNPNNYSSGGEIDLNRMVSSFNSDIQDENSTTSKYLTRAFVGVANTRVNAAAKSEQELIKAKNKGAAASYRSQLGL